MPIQHEKSRRRVAIAAAILAVACLLAPVISGPSGVRADPGGRPAELKAEIEGLSESLQRSREQYDQARERARVASGTQVALGSRISAGRARLAALQERVSREGRRAASAGRSLTRARAILAQRLVDIYMAGSPQIDDLLLASGDYGDFVSRSAYLDAIGDSDRALARRVAELRRARVAALRAAREGRAEVRSELSTLQEEVAAIAAVRAEAEGTASRLSRLQGSREDEISALRDRIATIESEQSEGAPAGEAFLGGPYSIPTYIVMCESGGNYSALNPSSGAGGAYQIIPSTWEAYGGKGLPHEASKAEQDRIAALIWANDGPGAWVCA